MPACWVTTGKSHVTTQCEADEQTRSLWNGKRLRCSTFQLNLSVTPNGCSLCINNASSPDCGLLIYLLIFYSLNCPLLLYFS